MKYLPIAIIVLFTVACSTPDNNSSEPKNLDWLEGNWVRTNDEQSIVTYEEWTKVSDKEFVGRGFSVNIDSTIFEPDTVFMENIKIMMSNDTLIYEVTGVNENPTPFKFIEQTDTSFVCINSSNDFPKKIAYSVSAGRMTAVISGQGPDIQFFFRRND